MAHDPEVLLHALLGRQALGVPAGNVGAVEATQSPVLHGDVFEDLVQRLTEVDVTVGVRGAIVQDIGGRPLAQLAHAGVDVHVLPLREDLRLALWEVAAHRELGSEQVECVLVVHPLISSRRMGRGGVVKESPRRDTKRAGLRDHAIRPDDAGMDARNCRGTLSHQRASFNLAAPVSAIAAFLTDCGLRGALRWASSTDAGIRTEMRKVAPRIDRV